MLLVAKGSQWLGGESATVGLDLVDGIEERTPMEVG